MNIQEVPSPIDFKNMGDAQAWEKEAMERPHRLEFFEKFSEELKNINKPQISVLELGSGPGFLANYLLNTLPNIYITLIDFSEAMHTLCKKRNNSLLKRIKFITRDFKESNWSQGLGKFDAVITNQAVHELRHKSYAEKLHRDVKPLLNKTGVYLVCDHYYEENTNKNNQLYMNLKEHTNSLQTAGYRVSNILVKGGRVLNRAT